MEQPENTMVEQLTTKRMDETAPELVEGQMEDLMGSGGMGS